MIEKKAPAGMKFEFGSEADPLTWRVRVKSPVSGSSGKDRVLGAERAGG